MTAAQLTQAARQLIDAVADPASAVWSRSAALLARQALELRLAEVLDLHAPGAKCATFRAQLVCLKALFKDRASPQHVAYTWAALSRATHHAAYALAPTAVELATWLETVESFIGEDFQRLHGRANATDK